jgi:internalin A
LKKRIERTPPKNEIECPLGEEDVYVPRMLYGLHPDTTYQMLSRKLDDMRDCIDDTRDKLEEALGDLRLLQRDLTKHYNALQRAEEASCPSLFVMRGATYDGDLIGLFGPTGSHGMLDSLREKVWKRRVELQLYCQQPGCWHPIGYERGKDDPATGLYQIEIGSDFLKLVAPHLTRVAKLFKLSQPLLGAWASWAEPEKYAKQFKEDLDRMKKFAEQVAPAVEDSLDAKRAGALVEGRDPREATGAMLRALKRLLE